MYNIPYYNALYRRNNAGDPCVWYCYKVDNETIAVQYGTVTGKIITEKYKTSRNVDDEIKSRFAAKRKIGYKSILEIRDNNDLPVEGDMLALNDWLNIYLPINRTTENNVILPMLAKIYDNKVFNRCPIYLGQWKINGLRCLIKVIKSNSLFQPFKLQFQSREGEIWNTLITLEDYLLHVISQDILIKLYNNDIILDGEIYLPGYTVNQINHFVKDMNCPENKLLQFWCYDIAYEEASQSWRTSFIMNNFSNFSRVFSTKTEHYNNKQQFIVLPNVTVTSSEQATVARNKFIDLGFEGLILRNPDAIYNFGKRSAKIMIKYKKSTDGIFKVVDIKPEGIRRSYIPLLICKNDINNNLFECHLSANIDYQRLVLEQKENYIGKNVYVEYGERSGVLQVPFHVKEVHFIND